MNKNFLYINISLILVIFIFIGCGSQETFSGNPINDTLDNNKTIDTTAPTVPLLISPENNTTTFLDTVEIKISGEVNASIYKNGIDTNIDINSSNQALISLSLNNGYVSYDYNITLKDDANNTSENLIFKIEKLYDINTSKRIKAMTIGYIKDANVTSITDALAVYNDTNNTYIFESSPSYIINLNNGILKDNNRSNKVNMTTSIGLVINPITTILEINPNSKDKLATILGIGSSLENFSKDYIATNDLNFAKIASISYIALSDENISSLFINQLSDSSTSITSVSEFINVILSDINSSNQSIFEKYFNIKFINEVNLFSSNVGTLVSTLNDTIYSIDGNYSFHQRKQVLKTNQSICYDNTNQSNQIACSDVNATGDGNVFGEDRAIISSIGIIKMPSINLIWQDNSNVEILKNWDSANKYCNDSNESNINEWSLPSIEELINIVDRNASGTNLTDINFNNKNKTDYWSKTPYKNIDKTYWTLFLNNGMVGYTNSGTEHYVRCVYRQK